MTCAHTPMNAVLGHVAHAEWMAKQRGQQRQCPTCKLWFFRSEYGPGWNKAIREPPIVTPADCEWMLDQPRDGEG